MTNKNIFIILILNENFVKAWIVGCFVVKIFLYGDRDK